MSSQTCITSRLSSQTCIISRLSSQPCIIPRLSSLNFIISRLSLQTCIILRLSSQTFIIYHLSSQTCIIPRLSSQTFIICITFSGNTQLDPSYIVYLSPQTPRATVSRPCADAADLEVNTHTSPGWSVFASSYTFLFTCDPKHSRCADAANLDIRAVPSSVFYKAQSMQMLMFTQSSPVPYSEHVERGP